MERRPFDHEPERPSRQCSFEQCRFPNSDLRRGAGVASVEMWRAVVVEEDLDHYAVETAHFRQLVSVVDPVWMSSGFLPVSRR